MGRIRLFPLTFAEIQSQNKFTTVTGERGAFLKYLTFGGLPEICFVRDDRARSELLQDWIDLTCQRDLHQFKKLKLDSELAYQLLKGSAQLEEPTLANLAKFASANLKKVATHVNALCEFFVFNKLDPHPSGTGKPI